MGMNNTVVFCIVMFLVVILSSIQCRSDHSKQLRPTRGFIKELTLGTARGFGKRAVNMHTVNNILLEWMALESKLKNLNQQPRRLRYEEEFLPE